MNASDHIFAQAVQAGRLLFRRRWISSLDSFPFSMLPSSIRMTSSFLACTDVAASIAAGAGVTRDDFILSCSQAFDEAAIVRSKLDAGETGESAPSELRSSLDQMIGEIIAAAAKEKEGEPK